MKNGSQNVIENHPKFGAAGAQGLDYYDFGSVLEALDFWCLLERQQVDRNLETFVILAPKGKHLIFLDGSAECAVLLER